MEKIHVGLNAEQRTEIKALLNAKLEEKLRGYARETVSMPFLTRLIQNNRQVASYSFIHSLATTLGMSLYEDVSKIIASAHSRESFTKYDLGGVISREQSAVISDIVQGLRNGEEEASHVREKRLVLASSSKGGRPRSEGRIADFYMKRNKTEYFFEIKTAKPNLDIFKKKKTKLLEWIARRRRSIRVFLVLPYNPYHPDPYERFTEAGLFERGADFLVADEYWNLLGGARTYENLLNIFDQVGRRWRERIQHKIRKVASIRMAA